MSSILSRRKFLTRTWQAGLGLIGAFGMWSMWELLQPLATAGFGGKVRAVSPLAVKEGSIKEIPEARAYLVHPPGGEIMALSWKCPHLGCRVPYCDSSGKFECPCHGSFFNSIGEWLEGPSPKGLSRYPIEVGSDGLIYIDTGTEEAGPAAGPVTIETPPGGPSCSEGQH